MGQDPGTSSAEVTGRHTEVTGAQDPAQIRREIEETREQLGDTVEQLARKTDVKGQAKRKVQDARTSVSEKTEQLLGRAREVSPDGAASAAAQASRRAKENPIPLAAVGVFAAGFLAGRLTRR